MRTRHDPWVDRPSPPPYRAGLRRQRYDVHRLLLLDGLRFPTTNRRLVAGDLCTLSDTVSLVPFRVAFHAVLATPLGFHLWTDTYDEPRDRSRHVRVPLSRSLSAR